MLESRSDLRRSRRMVIKIGTSVLFENGALSRNRLKVLARQTAALRKEGREVILVSSGAVGVGWKKLGLAERPGTLLLKQACAAVGQAFLMTAWEKALADEGLLAAQVLISADDLSDRTRFLNAKTLCVPSWPTA